MPNKFELQKVAFIDTSDLSDTVVLSTMLEGSGGATRAFVEDEVESYIAEDNQSIDDTVTYPFTMAGLPTDSTDEAQLATWANGNSKLSIVGVAYGQFMEIQNAYLQFIANTTERRTWVLKVKRTGGIGYDDNGKMDTEFMMSSNGLDMYKWQEGATNLPAGWTKTGGTTSWGSGSITFSTAGATVLYLVREDIYVPHLVGKTLNASITVSAVTDTTGLYLGLAYYDSSDTIIGTESKTDITTTGAVSVSAVVPSTAMYARLRVKIAQNDSVTFATPTLEL